jgi:hypothetical protein
MRIARPMTGVIVAAVLAAQTWGASTAVANPVTVSDESVIVSADQRLAAGLVAWPDGPMGVTRSGSGYTFFGANSGNVARTAGSLDSPLVAGVSARTEVLQARRLADVRYASGGPIYEVGNGIKLMFIHLERRPAGTIRSWYGSIGLAQSVDGGRSWSFLGEIFTHQLSYKSYRKGACGTVAETSFGQYVIRRIGGADYFHIYSPDTQANCDVNFAVARAPVRAVVAAARRGSVSPWKKLRDGSWGAPGLGGASSDTGANRGRRSFAIAYSPTLQGYVLAATGVVSPGVHGISLSTSTDGISWSAPQVAFVSVGELYAPTIVGLGSDPTVASQRFHIYYAHSRAAGFGGYRWSDASLRRRTIDTAVGGVATRWLPRLPRG